jgi:hypothetical protein
MTTSKNLKPAYNTLALKTNSGATIQVKRTSTANLSRLMVLQEELLVEYVRTDGALGALLSDDLVVEKIREFLGLLPVVGKEGEYLDYDLISENWEQLFTLVFNSAYDEEKRESIDVKPSLVSNLHFLPYPKMINPLIQARALEEEETRMKQALMLMDIRDKAQKIAEEKSGKENS